MQACVGKVGGVCYSLHMYFVKLTTQKKTELLQLLLPIPWVRPCIL